MVESTLRCQQLRLFALKILSVRPHTAAVESLFSCLGLAKTTSRNRLGVEKLKMTALIRSRIQVQEDKRKSARSFPSNERKQEGLGEEEGEETETISEETTEVEIESLHVDDEESEESGQDTSRFAGEDKTLVEVFFNIETYNDQSRPRNTEQEEAGGDESDFSINDILQYH